MKKWMIAILATLLVITSVSAQSTNSTTYAEPEYKTPVIDESLDFEATRDGSMVRLEWNTYDGDDFKYYKVMRSETHSNPVYPDQPALIYFPNSDQFYHKFGNWGTKTAVYRVCVITTDKSRICSNTVKLAGYVHEKKEYTNEEKEYKKIEYTKKEYVKKQAYKAKKLDSRLQARADQIVAKLIKRLEDKHGTDNEAKVKKLSDLTTKLNKINDRIKSEKTKALVTYLVEALEKKKAEYGTSDDIEEIFNLLEK